MVNRELLEVIDITSAADIAITMRVDGHIICRLYRNGEVIYERYYGCNTFGDIIPDTYLSIVVDAFISQPYMVWSFSKIYLDKHTDQTIWLPYIVHQS